MRAQSGRLGHKLAAGHRRTAAGDQRRQPRFGRRRRRIQQRTHRGVVHGRQHLDAPQPAMGTGETNPDRVFLPPTSRNPDELSKQADPAQPSAKRRQTSSPQQPSSRQPPSRSSTPNHLRPSRDVPLLGPLRRRSLRQRAAPASESGSAQPAGVGSTAPRLKGAWGPGQAPCRPHPAKGHPASEGRRLRI